MRNKIKWIIKCSIVLLSTTVISQTTSEKNNRYIKNIATIVGEKNDGFSKLSLGMNEIYKNKSSQRIPNNWITKGDYIKINTIAVSDAIKLQKDLESVGVVHTKVHGITVSGWIHKDELFELEKLASLKKVMPEFKGLSNVGTVTTQGEIAMNADAAKLNFGVTGKDVKVGIISTSYDVLNEAENSIINGDLPGANNPNDYTTEVVVLSKLNEENQDFVVIDEGRAMAEIVHDIAPEAELYFYSGLNGRVDFVDGIQALADAGCSIIVDDVFYREQPYFQDGDVALAVDQVSAQGVGYFTSAGNKGRNSYESSFVGSGVIVDGNELHDFGNGDISQSITVLPDGFVDIWLQWDDPSLFVNPNGPSPDTDLNFFLMDADTGDILDSSTFDNILEGVPIEFVFFVNDTDIPKEIEIVISKAAGPNPKLLKYIDFGVGLEINEHNTFSGTSIGHQNAEGAISVGAVFYGDTPNFEGLGDVEFFSSAGGVPILLDFDGEELPLAIVRQKPDIVAPDAGNNSFLGFDIEGDGFPNFFGTSAAAPHAAAVAALMAEYSNEPIEPDNIRKFMQETALDMDDPLTEEFDTGFDFASGYGLIDANAALQRISETLSINEFGYENVLSVFPNPSAGIVYFENNSKNAAVDIKIYNLLGSFIEDFKLNPENKKMLDFGIYSSGIYIAQFESENGKNTKKVLIN